MTDQPLARIICFLNNKGGVGKTTMTTLFAEFLCLELKKRVLVIDFDGQLNTTATWIPDCPQDATGRYVTPPHPDYDENDPIDVQTLNRHSAITDIYQKKLVLPHRTIYEETEDNPACVDVIPCNNEDIQAFLDLFRPTSHQKHPRLHVRRYEDLVSMLYNFLLLPEVGGAYDYILIDSAPSETPLFRAAIDVSRFVVSPYEPTALSIQNIPTIITNISASYTRAKREGRTPPTFLGCFPNKVQINNRRHKPMIEDLIDTYGKYHWPRDKFLKLRQIYGDAGDPHVKDEYKSVFEERNSVAAKSEAVELFTYMNQRIEEVAHGEA